MTHTLGTIREFETNNFRVVVDAIPEEDLDLSFDDSGETARKLENGTFIAFCARARVFLKATGQELSSDYLGGCIYESLRAFEDHRECGIQNRKHLRNYGAFQIYRKNRPYESCLRSSDKLKRRGFATRERADAWAKENVIEAYEIFQTGRCGSYFASMISTAIVEARKNFSTIKQSLADVRLRQTETQTQGEN
jgi:hypothetical protein